MFYFTYNHGFRLGTIFTFCILSNKDSKEHSGVTYIAKIQQIFAVNIGRWFELF